MPLYRARYLSDGDRGSDSSEFSSEGEHAEIGLAGSKARRQKQTVRTGAIRRSFLHGCNRWLPGDDPKGRVSDFTNQDPYPFSAPSQSPFFWNLLHLLLMHPSHSTRCHSDATNYPTVGCSVRVHYEGRLEEDGSLFDSSRERGRPIEFKVSKRRRTCKDEMSTRTRTAAAEKKREKREEEAN